MPILDTMTVTFSVRKPQKVFVVHGRDEALKQSVFDFLRSMRLQPMEFNEAIGLTGKSSPYIGEVLNCAFKNAQAVVVLLTGDDEVRLLEKYWERDEPDYEREFHTQPRPNVLFEAGMAFGRKPRRTILVQVGTIKQISDLQGRHVLKLDNTEKKRLEFASKLMTARCDVDISGNGWKNAGNFQLSD